MVTFRCRAAIVVALSIALPVAVSAQDDDQPDPSDVAGEPSDEADEPPDGADEEAAFPDTDGARDDRDARVSRRSGKKPPPERHLEAALRIRLPGVATAAPALLERVAYVPIRGGRVLGVDIDTGRVTWTNELPTQWALAAGDGLIFAAAPDRLVAVAPDGGTRWMVPIPGGFSAPPFWDTGWLIAATASGDVLCLRARDGHVFWTRRLPSPVGARPTIAADRVYLSLQDGRVAALDLRSGTPMWERRLGGRPGPALALDDRLFVGASDKYFYCLSTESGDRKWRWRTGGAIVAAPVVDLRHVYFTSFDNVLRALDRSNGTQRWKAGLPLRPAGGPLLMQELVVVVGVGGEVHGYAARTGAAGGEIQGTEDLAVPPQLLASDIAEFTSVVLFTRTGELVVLRRRIEPPVVPFEDMIGVSVPLVAPPAPTR